MKNKMFKSKKGNEILQVLIVIAVIGALAITICTLISSKLKHTAKSNLNTVGSGITNAAEVNSPAKNGGYDPYANS